MLTRSSIMGLLFALAALLVLPSKANAVTMQLEFAPFTGSDSSILINLNDEGGIITGEVNVIANPNIGDLRAIFLQVIDDSILPHLQITGSLISGIEINANSVTGSGDANVNGDGGPGPFDIGIEFGSPGIGFDDIQSASFVIAHESSDLSLDMFDLSNWAARLTSVGIAGGPREGSSKLLVTNIRLTGLVPPDGIPTPGGDPTPSGDPNPPGLPGNSQIAPIPEPGTAALLILAGAAGGGYWRRRRRQV